MALWSGKIRKRNCQPSVSVTLRQSAMWLAGGAPALLQRDHLCHSAPEQSWTAVLYGQCRLKRIVSIATTSSATIATCVALGDALQPAKTYVIEIGGSPGVGVSGECRLAKADGDEDGVPIEGVVPLNLTLTGRGLDCRLERRGPSGTLEVVLSDGQGSTTRSQTSGGSGIIALSLR
jgi:hypothetical protein